MQFNAIGKHAQFVAAVGQAGSGKTEYFKRHLDAMPLKSMHIYDFNGEYSYLSKKIAGYFKAEFGTVDELAKFMDNALNVGKAFVFVEDGEEALSEYNDYQRRFFLRARNRQTGAWFNIKSPMSVKPFFRRRFNKMALFHMDEPRELKYLEEWVGVEDLSMLASFEPGQHVVVDFTKPFDDRISDIVRFKL